MRLVSVWHLGFKTGKNNWQVPLRPGPQDVGFDHYFGVPLVNSGSPYVYVEDDSIVGYDPNDPLKPGGKPISPTPTFPEEASKKSVNIFGGALKAHQIYDGEKTGTLLTERAVKWITEKKDEPFFLYFQRVLRHCQRKGTRCLVHYGNSMLLKFLVHAAALPRIIGYNKST